MFPQIKRKYSRTLAFPGRVCCGPAWSVNSGGLNGAIGAAGLGLWHIGIVAVGLMHPFVCVLSSLISWS